MSATPVLEHRGPTPDQSFAERLRREVVGELGQAMPEESGELASVVDPLVETIRTTILCCLDTMTNPRGLAGDDWSAVFRARRRELVKSCRPDLLVWAYRIGGQVAWRHASHYARTRRIPAAAVARGAEVIFAYLGELSGLTGATQARPVSGAAARRRLVRLIMADPAPAPGQLTEAAREAGWALPAALRVVALRRPATGDQGVPADLLREHLVDTESAEPCLLVADTVDVRGLAVTLRTALPGWTAAIGPSAALSEVRSSLRVATRALDLAARELIPADGGVVDCAEHRLTLALFADEYLIAELAERRLAPLRDLTARRQDRMLRTLHEWLASQGRVTEMAARMGVHPQTVRYRIHRLEELFGDQLADPRGRFELELAVRAAVLKQPGEGTDTEIGAASAS
ncbi:CdaR family transcriptional regulator [Actinokineospora sp. UTMC 2448]|uniref:PucR family transcriptional regulator n=1 Tax=Actinokineospora sp. UTMC 2448 TaxID=2268449 RepID=UPI0021649A7D|nr:PucR family transcriptional regulator [Actinokineospora sp. UTMC 2448]UVS77567.1 Sugar diacid utilization regulator [Actinokineospora sp. UTMC 2448]